MAVASHLCFSLPKLSLHSPRRLPRTIRSGGGGNMLGDFGARDPFPAQVESRFGGKVLGNASTEHKILIPNISALSLSQLECDPLSPLQSPISKEEVQALLRKKLGSFILSTSSGRFISDSSMSLRANNSSSIHRTSSTEPRRREKGTPFASSP